LKRGLSSIYGFIVVYLLVIASLQVISSSVSSQAAAANAYQESQELGQSRSLEHLTLAISGRNVTMTNDGLVPSVVSYLLLANSSKSTLVPVGRSLAIGSSLSLGARGASTISAVTSLGGVFTVRGSPSSSQSSWKGWEGVGGPDVDMQLFQNPSDTSRFFASEGPWVYAFSSSGSLLWSFDGGPGEVTDVLPLSNGYVYASLGYYGSTRTATLYELSSAGAVVNTYSVRLLRLYTTVDVQYPAPLPPFPVGSEPVQRAADSTYVVYDGWFYSSSGASSVSYPGDAYNLAASDSSNFYVYTVLTDTGEYGCGYPRGNIIDFEGYSAGSSGVSQQWQTYVYTSACNLYPNSLISASTNSGVVAALFADDYNSQPNYYGGPYGGTNPFLAVLSSSGSTLYSGRLDRAGYSSVATDGTNVYLSIPGTQQVEKIVIATGTTSIFNIGIPAQDVLWAYNSLFAISGSQVNVYDSSLDLKQTVAFAPYSFYSLSNSQSYEPALTSPSFLVLNSTSYAALVRNGSGFGDLQIGKY
jgi:hypothetical protein